MRNKTCLIGFAIGLVLLISCPAADCQIIYGQPTSAQLQMIFTGWTLDYGDSAIDVNQVMIPLSGFVPLGKNLDANYYLANSSNKLNEPTSSSNLSGLSDFNIQVNHAFQDDAFLVSGGINLPTGKKKLSLTDEWPILQFLSRDFLAFPMSRFGEGFGFNLLFGAARMVGQFKCRGGISYQLIGSYTPINGGPSYNPGDMFNINAGAELQKKFSKFNADLIGTLYTPDKLGGTKSFKQGSQVDLRLSGQYGKKSYNLAAGLRYLIRGRNTDYGLNESVVEQLKIYGNEFGASGVISLMFNDWTFAPMAEIRLIAKNETGLGNSKVYGVGGSLNKNLGANTVFGFGFEYLSGKADASRISLTGYSLNSHLTAGF